MVFVKVEPIINQKIFYVDKILEDEKKLKSEVDKKVIQLKYTN
jgi:hypothetical protein